MENSPNNPPTPDLFYYGRKYSDLIDRLEKIRSKFIEERGDQGLTKEELNETIQLFETQRIEKILKKANRKDFPWHPQEVEDEDAEYYDATSDTIIDTEDNIILRAESTAYYQDAPSQVEVDRIYSLDTLGKIQISTESTSETDEDALEREQYPVLGEFNFDDDDISEHSDSNQLDLNHAKSLTEMLELNVDELEKEYSNPDWYIMPDSFSEGPGSTNKKYVIEKAQKDD